MNFLSKIQKSRDEFISTFLFADTIPFFTPPPFRMENRIFIHYINRIPPNTSRPYLRSERRHSERLFTLHEVGLLQFYGFAIILTTVYVIY